MAPLSFLPWACRPEEIVPYEHCSLPLPAGEGSTDYNRDWAKMCNLSQQNSLLFVPLQLGSCSKRDVIFQVTFNQSLVHKKTPELTARLFFFRLVLRFKFTEHGTNPSVIFSWVWNVWTCYTCSSWNLSAYTSLPNMKDQSRHLYAIELPLLS